MKLLLGMARDTSAKSNQLYADQYDQDASTLAETESGGLQADVEGASNQSTLASVGSNAVITAGDDLTVRASDEHRFRHKCRRRRCRAVQPVLA